MHIANLLIAKYAEQIPVFEDRPRTAAQKAGLAYERTIIRRLQALHENVKPGPWLYYKTKITSGVCQPDALVWLSPNLICIVEVKLTWQRTARDKLLNFYGPIVSEIHNTPLCYLQVYKNWKRGCHKRPVNLFELEKLKPGVYKECHSLS